MPPRSRMFKVWCTKMKTTYFNPDAEIGRFHTDAISQRRLVQADALPSQRPCNFASWIVCSQESVLLFSRKLASFCQLKSLLLEQGIDRGWNRKSNEKSQSASPLPRGLFGSTIAKAQSAPGTSSPHRRQQHHQHHQTSSPLHTIPHTLLFHQTYLPLLLRSQLALVPYPLASSSRFLNTSSAFPPYFWQGCCKQIIALPVVKPNVAWGPLDLLIKQIWMIWRSFEHEWRSKVDVVEPEPIYAQGLSSSCNVLSW